MGGTAVGLVFPLCVNWGMFWKGHKGFGAVECFCFPFLNKPWICTVTHSPWGHEVCCRIKMELSVILHLPFRAAWIASKGKLFKYNFPDYWIGRPNRIWNAKAFLILLFASSEGTPRYRCCLFAQGHFQTAEYQRRRDGQPSASCTF